ncbi:kinetoplastid kinetochore protein 2 / KKT2 [Leishmania donovani]|uniref:Serine/threonine-protein kinase PLK n=2 Tax=Leishmania donovani TaxID=5661 RepID=A0A3Q8IWE9_LEIDO|nr:protein kinase, putative [Leishmania donovani]AYU83915.1 kinetoplastid kinetochore protein 2, putative [Leishmania donovani]CAJ1993932.1 kinetoplastid kinetochore protein 2 / KKT2 [Leishmania donovani]CBZ38994.1 protein kinase, putative [Leishmania donovani]VDZ49753.1 kinetoplastid_kinetochore_protein_2_putative/GeneDB:LmjF.36.5350 [Leishmania donovani]
MSHLCSSLSRTPPRGGAISMPRDLSQTPAISRLGSTVKTPHIQKCVVDQTEDDDHPLEHMTVYFEEEDLRLVTTGLLGKGGFGKVFDAVSNSGEAYALKVSSKRMSENDWKRLKEEVTLMSHFSRHPNIVKFYAAGRDEDRAYVVMERCAGKSLHDVIASRGLDVPEILWIGWALVNTISYIHSKGCIHRDLKPQNLLFDHEGNLKITDFGLSSRISEAHPRKTVAGTAMYMAPEMATEVYKRMTKNSDAPSLSYGKEVDTWSIGVVLYVLLTRMNPYLEAIEQKGMRQLDKEHKSLALFNAVAGAAWSWPREWRGDPQLCRLVERVLHREPSQRATLMEVLEDSVWNRRPLSCPLSLLQKLNLLEPSPSSGLPLNNLAENLQFRPKRSAEAVLREGLERIEATEQRGRAQLELEYYETYNVLWCLLTLARAEEDARADILQSEEVQRGKLRNQSLARQSARGRCGSVSLVSEVADREVAASRTSRSVRRSVSLTEQEQGRLVRSSPVQYAVVYPGRDTATRWNLRAVVSLPRDMTAEIEREFKCMNGHVMTKLTSMPHGYNGFDCNVCDRGILKITGESPAFRCYKCDYDVCMKCAYSGKFKDVNFVCVTCAKRFTSTAKLQGHTLRCRGPSESPSPRRSSRMNTMLWDEPKRPSLLEVQLPEAPQSEPKLRASRCRSGRPTYNRTSTGGRISIGDPNAHSVVDFDAMVAEHREADFPKVSARASATGRESSQKRERAGSRRGRPSTSSSGSLSLDLPPQVQVPSKESRAQVQPRSSAELRDIMEEVEQRKQALPRDPLLSGPATPPQYNCNGEIIGIAARRRAESLEMARAEVITIRAEVADRPRELQHQPRVPRSASSSRAEKGLQGSHKRRREEWKQSARAPSPSGTAKRAAVEEHVAKHAIMPPQVPRGRAQQSRAPSVSGHTAQGGPPLPRRGPAAPFPAAALKAHLGAFQVPAAIPPKNFASILPSRYSMTNAMAPTCNTSTTRPADGAGAAAADLGRGGAPTYSHVLGRPNGAFLALPREERNRQQFLDDFLSGGWVRFYSFTNEDTVVMYYSLQPGRYGAMFPTEAGVGTAVLDVYSKLVLYVPCMNNESTNRSQPHPHVQTFYDEEARILSLPEAQRYLGGVLRCITGFVDEFSRLKAEGLTPAAVHAAYIHHRSMSHVPRDTKFVYIRKVFPDPSGSFTLFRLSNLRSQVVCNAMVDIRWQSDRRHNVGQKYYINADGTAEPFLVDQTGILSQLETVLNNNFRR